jgi:hypothetical protein
VLTHTHTHTHTRFIVHREFLEGHRKQLIVGSLREQIRDSIGRKTYFTLNIL